MAGGRPARMSSRPEVRPPSPSGSSAPMRCSVFTVGDNLEENERRPGRFREILDYVELADRLGYWGFFFAEHHFDPHGEIADPWLLVTAAAERTRGGRLRLGPMVSNLAFRHPVQVAEQALLAQEIAEGRLEIGVGSGNVLREHVAFGLVPDPTARKRAAFDQNLPRLVHALEGRPIPASDHPGGSVHVPIPPISEVTRHLWIAVGRTEAAVRFAREGHPVALGPPFATMDGLPALQDQVASIRAALPPDRTPRIAAAFPAYVGDARTRALAALDRFLVGKHRDGTAHLPVGVPSPRPAVDATELVRRNLALIGRPEEVVGQLRAIAVTGITDLLVIPDFGGLEPALVSRSLIKIAGLMGGLGFPDPTAEPSH